MQGNASSLGFDGGIKLSPTSQSVASALRKDTCQDASTWWAFHRLRLPPQDSDFIYTALWKKLSVGKCLHAAFLRIPSMCPLCGACEDMYHRLKACLWLIVPLRVLDCSFPVVRSLAGRVPTGRLCSDFPVLFLSKAQGVLFWKTLRVLWLYRCAVPFCLSALHPRESVMSYGGLRVRTRTQNLRKPPKGPLPHMNHQCRPLVHDRWATTRLQPAPLVHEHACGLPSATEVGAPYRGTNPREGGGSDNGRFDVSTADPGCTGIFLPESHPDTPCRYVCTAR